MKTPALFFKTTLLVAVSVMGLQAAPAMSESFDKLPSSEKWKSDALVSVADGSLVLTASGMNTTYANTAFTLKAGDAKLNFTTKPVELVFGDLSVGGTAAPGDSVLVVILSADTPGEGNSSSYLKVRLSDDGTFMLMCGAAGTKEATLHRLAAKLTFPVKTLKIKLTATDFSISGTDATKEFSGAGQWAAPFDPSVWTGASPYLMLRSVRRPGEGEAVVKVGALTVTTSP
jgi:hypothetical protein